MGEEGAAMPDSELSPAELDHVDIARDAYSGR
jgi:hypothetical protein